MTEIVAALERVASELARDLEKRGFLSSETFRAEVKPILAAALAACAREEQEACKADIQEAIGNWGGPEREHYTQAMQRAITAIENRAKGLDLWGRALERAVEEKAVL